MPADRPPEDRLTSHLTRCVMEYLAEPDGRFEWRVDGEYYDIEEATPPDWPLVLARRSDGARFEVDVDLTVWPMRALPAATPTPSLRSDHV